jgi:hypothetical protein
MADTWSEAPLIYLPRESCPWCGSLATPHRIKTLPLETDGSFSRRSICKTCSRRYVVVLEILEPPESGGSDQAVA